MKKIFLFQFLFVISTQLFAQSGDSLLTNFNTKASVWYTVAGFMKINSDDPRHFKAYNKIFTTLRANDPADDANVTVDSLPTMFAVDIYRYLSESVALVPEFDKFKTSVTNDRNTNAFFDGKLDAIDTEKTTAATTILNNGYFLIHKKPKP